MEQKSAKQFRVTEDLLAKTEQRFINWLLDVIIQVLIFMIIFSIITPIALSYGYKQLPHYLLYDPIGQYTFVSCICLVYYVPLETITGRTIGKLVTQTIVVDENGEIPPHSIVLMRNMGRMIPMYAISFIINPKRGIHDYLSRTYVVDKKQLEERKRQFYSLK